MLQNVSLSSKSNCEKTSFLYLNSASSLSWSIWPNITCVPKVDLHVPRVRRSFSSETGKMWTETVSLRTEKKFKRNRRTLECAAHFRFCSKWGQCERKTFRLKPKNNSRNTGVPYLCPFLLCSSRWSPPNHMSFVPTSGWSINSLASYDPTSGWPIDS